MNDTGNRVIAAIIVVLIIIGAWYLGTTIKSSGKAATGTPATSTTSGTGKTSSTPQGSTSTGAVTVGGDAISIGDQSAGSFVTVKSVTLTQAGWVAVRDSAGKTLGAGWFDVGTHTAVQVPLLRNTEAGQSYQVLLYADDGDRSFDLHKDTLVMNADGSVAGASFKALNGN